jgi:uncharacterized membrane protein YgcG
MSFRPKPWGWFAAFLTLLLSFHTEAAELPRLSLRVNDFVEILHPTYVADLDWRLGRYREKTGYSMYIVLVRENLNQSLRSIAADLFQAEHLESSGRKIDGCGALEFFDRNIGAGLIGEQ